MVHWTKNKTIQNKTKDNRKCSMYRSTVTVATSGIFVNRLRLQIAFILHLTHTGPNQITTSIEFQWPAIFSLPLVFDFAFGLMLLTNLRFSMYRVCRKKIFRTFSIYRVQVMVLSTVVRLYVSLAIQDLSFSDAASKHEKIQSSRNQHIRSYM